MNYMNQKSIKIKTLVLLLPLLGSAKVFAQNENNFSIPPIKDYTKEDDSVKIPWSLGSVNSKSTININTEVSKDTIQDETVLPKQSIRTQQEIHNPFSNDTETKLIIDKKNFLKDDKKETSLWQGATVVVSFISGIGFLGYLLAKMSRRRVFKVTKAEQAMNVISSLTINPKRQLLLIQVRDKEIILANTESGIQLISEVNLKSTITESLHEKKAFPIEDLIKKLPHNSSPISKSHDAEDSLSKRSDQEKKSDILVKALKRMENEPLKEKERKNELIEDENSSSPKFQKYFSNMFESEAKKDYKRKEDSDSVENVTNLIREKLRSMKPLN
jgi:flagellar biogenesis protein FliO